MNKMKHVKNMKKDELITEILKLETRYADTLQLLSMYNTQMFYSTDVEQTKFWCNEMLEKICMLDKERSAAMLFKLTDKKDEKKENEKRT